MNEFKDRVSSNLNKKKYIIEENTVERNDCGEIVSFVAEEIRNDNPADGNEGTPLNAENLNKIIQGMIDKEINTLALTDEEKVKSVLSTLSIPNEVKNELILPLLWHRECLITWEVVSGEGIIITNNTASITQELFNQYSVIKSTITSGNYSESKKFEIKILKKEINDALKVKMDMDSVVIPTNVTSSFILPISGQMGSCITWIAAVMIDGPSLSGNSVIVQRGTANSGIILVGTFKIGNYSYSKQYDVRVIGTDCFTPKIFSTSITQLKNSPKSKSFTITTSTLDNLWIKVDNDNIEDLNIVLSNNGTTSVEVSVTETIALNTSTGSGSEIIDFCLKVYFNNTLLVGTIPCSICYYYSSETPED